LAAGERERKRDGGYSRAVTLRRGLPPRLLTVKFSRWVIFIRILHLQCEHFA
jgi:hypothetical protein